jgi:hypothetical protein
LDGVQREGGAGHPIPDARPRRDFRFALSTSASDLPDPGDGWAGAVFFLVIAAGCTVAAGRAVRRQLREHLEPAQQPTEAG